MIASSQSVRSSSIHCPGNHPQQQSATASRNDRRKPQTELSSSSKKKKNDTLLLHDDENPPWRTGPCSTTTVVRDGDYVLFAFSDGRRLFGQCCAHNTPKGGSGSGSGSGGKVKVQGIRIHKRTFPTAHVIGLAYGTVLELRPGTGPGPGHTTSNHHHHWVPLPAGEALMPSFHSHTTTPCCTEDDNDDACIIENAISQPRVLLTHKEKETTTPTVVVVDDSSCCNNNYEQTNDNRHMVDDNTSQTLTVHDVQRLKDSGLAGSAIVSTLIANSSSFAHKSDFSQAKYIRRKQRKYQLRCRLIRCTAATICQALFMKDPKRLMNLRDDTLAQVLSYSNVSAGCQTLVFEELGGIITGALAERMGGYGRVISVYQGQQPAWTDMLAKFNLTFAEHNSIKFLHAGDVFIATDHDPHQVVDDDEKIERDVLSWPCALQPHTLAYLQTMMENNQNPNPTDHPVRLFLDKRCARFARKLTRDTPLEIKQMLTSRLCDSIIVATRGYDPTQSLITLLPYLAPACPFVVYAEFMEPLTLCFQHLQQHHLAVNLRLSDTWMREYQVLPGRTHPHMNMSQSGGFLLTGIKLDPQCGQNELDERLLREIRADMGPRRGKKKKKEQTKQEPITPIIISNRSNSSLSPPLSSSPTTGHPPDPPDFPPPPPRSQNRTNGASSLHAPTTAYDNPPSDCCCQPMLSSSSSSSSSLSSSSSPKKKRSRTGSESLQFGLPVVPGVQGERISTP